MEIFDYGGSFGPNKSDNNQVLATQNDLNNAQEAQKF
jgi:hypothetical protein